MWQAIKEFMKNVQAQGEVKDDKEPSDQPTE